MTTSLCNKTPVPRPRQCWQQQQPKTTSTPSPSGNSKSGIQLSDDDVYRFLGKQFCLPRSPASAPACSRTEANKPISHPAVSNVTAAATAPPKPPRSINVSPSSAAGYSKAPKPLPRTMFLAVKTPPIRPSRPPVSYSSLRNQTSPAESNGIKSFGNLWDVK
jgi:hypothetical protein